MLCLQVGFDEEGKLLALDVQLYNNAGNSLDLSAAIMDRALLHTDNAYKIPHLRVVGHICKTHCGSNTAFRGFGGPQVGHHQPHVVAAHALSGRLRVALPLRCGGLRAGSGLALTHMHITFCILGSKTTWLYCCACAEAVPSMSRCI